MSCKANDRTQWEPWAVLVTLYVLSRLPLVFSGFGSDYDSYLYGQSGKHILERGVYEVSRFPGFPLYEQLCALFLRFGDWPLINALTVGVSVVTLLLFYYIMQRLGYKKNTRVLLCASLAFFPDYWINSASVMDYIWALSLLLGCYLALLHRRWELSAMCLALACGFRLTSGLFLVPYVFYMLNTPEMRRYVIPYSLITFTLLFICYAPLFVAYGLHFLRPSGFFELRPFLVLLYFCHRVYEFLGLVPGAFLLLGLILYRRRLRGYFSSTQNEKRMNVLIVALQLGLFFIFPGQTAYLLPLLPFLLLILGEALPFRYLVFLFCLFLGGNFVEVSIYNSEQRAAEVAVRQGALLSEIQERKRKIERPSSLAAIDFPKHSLVIVKGLPMAFGRNEQYFQIVEHTLGDQKFPVGRKLGCNNDVLYLNGMALNALPNCSAFLDGLKKEGYDIYMERHIYVTFSKLGDLFGVKLKDEWDLKLFEVSGDGVVINGSGDEGLE